MRVNKIMTWRGPLSVYEGKVLPSTNTQSNFDGKCSKCKEEIKLCSVYEHDSRCVECQYNLPKRKKRNK